MAESINEATNDADVPAAYASVRLDRSDPTPVYVQLSHQLRRLIDDGVVPAGSALPSERALSEHLDLSRMTIRRAVDELVHQRLLDRRHGSGTYVRGEPVRQAIDRLLGFSDEMRALGVASGSRLVSFTTVAADVHVARALEVTPGETVTRITRLRTADGRPLALQLAHLPERFQPFPIEKLMAGGSLYALLREAFGVTPHRAHQTVAARQATGEEMKLLDLPAPEPVLSLERITRDEADRVFEYVRSAYRGDDYQLELDLYSDEP